VRDKIIDTAIVSEKIERLVYIQGIQSLIQESIPVKSTLQWIPVPPGKQKGKGVI
jgi:hypothetical protein